MLNAHFKEEFKPRYQRNNKRHGQKNLRCFPTCSEGGHMGSGFCGRSISCTIENVQVPDPNYKIRSWGHFIECGADDELIPGQTITLDEAVDLERRREFPCSPWLRGEVSLDPEKQDTVDVVYNRQLLGWHYHWKSSKHKCDAHHSFKADFFFQAPDSNDLVYMGSALSPTFQIYSRHRQRGAVDPAAAQSLGRTKRRKLAEQGIIEQQPNKRVQQQQPKHDDGIVPSASSSSSSVLPLSPTQLNTDPAKLMNYLAAETAATPGYGFFVPQQQQLQQQQHTQQPIQQTTQHLENLDGNGHGHHHHHHHLLHQIHHQIHHQQQISTNHHQGDDVNDDADDHNTNNNDDDDNDADNNDDDGGEEEVVDDDDDDEDDVQDIL